MSETDWEGRYQSGDMPWEKGEPSPALVDFLATHSDLPRGSVFVPGCGTGHDVREWARAGFEVTGADLSPTAMRLAKERTQSAGLRAEFVVTDFLTAEPVTQFDWLFEHTLFCAIDPARRDDYVRSVLRSLQPRGQFLAVHYMLREGVTEPPFGVSQEELMQRFSPHFELLSGQVPRSIPNRAGLELMLHWRRK
ncbi:MAG TPA: methyltransferase domain-containing protein [Candidatus Acidoferrum sp.]|nr:methyltransferase domain-containing protein [Candidatus Acidoferrum sp.]